MKLILAALVLASASALQSPAPKAFGVAAVASAAFVGGPLAAPAVDVSPTTLVVNVKSDVDPLAAAKNVFQHRSQLQTAVKDFIGDVKQLGTDLDGVLPAADVNVALPEDWKQAGRDALVGQGRVVVNDKPVYFEVDSKEGFLTVKVLSPMLPKLPFLTPTDEQRASMVIPRAAPAAAVVTKQATQVAATAGQPFWEWAFTVPGTELDVTLPEAVVGLVAGAYTTTFGYHVASRALDDKKKADNKAKTAAAKKAREAAAAAAPATVDV